MSQLYRTHSKQQREPPPSLFTHPSASASHASLQGTLAPGASLTSQPRDRPGGVERAGSTRSRAHSRAGSVLAAPNPHGLTPRGWPSPESTRSADRSDALWAEMQATLEEVELSATGGTHVFGPEHDRKLADLRAAQIALAQAWARSEADDTIETGNWDTGGSAAGGEVRNLRGALGDASKTGTADPTEAAKSSGTNSIPRPGSIAGGDVERLGAKLEEETEVDILLARKRREANDRYFSRVNQGVIDVVTRLEDVAVAMRAVEQESRDVWSESGSHPGQGATKT